MENQISFKRRHRYYFELASAIGNIEPTQVVVKEKPKRSEVYQSGWEPVTFTISYDGLSNPDHGMPFLNLLAQFYKFGWETFQQWSEGGVENMESEISQMLGQGVLTLYSGIGEVMEKWTFDKMWPHSVNFGDLCYSSDPTVDLEITWRFKECQYYIPELQSRPKDEGIQTSSLSSTPLPPQ
jgi:hypothetical protein